MPHIALQQQFEQKRADLAIWLTGNLMWAPAALKGTNGGGRIGNVIAEAFQRQIKCAVVVPDQPDGELWLGQRQPQLRQPVPVKQFAGILFARRGDI